MYEDEVDLSLYYSKEDIQKLFKKTPQQLWRFEKYKQFPKSIIVKVKGRNQWIRPAKAFYLRSEVDAWVGGNTELIQGKSALA